MCRKARTCRSSGGSSVAQDLEQARETVAAAALECVAAAVPFRHQGRHVSVGLDCAGLLVHCVRVAGVPCVDERGYSRRPRGDYLRELLDAQPALQRISRHRAGRGDLLLFRIRRHPQHLGVCLGRGRMAHSYQTVGRVVNERIADRWADRLLAAYRIVKLEGQA